MARRAGASGGGNWGTTFRTPLDLTTVSAVEVAGVCGPLWARDGGAGELGCPGHGTGGLGPGVLLSFGFDPEDYTYVNYRAERMEVFSPGGDPGPAVDPPDRHGGGDQPALYRDEGEGLWHALLRQGENYHLYTLQPNPDLPADSTEVTQFWVLAEPERTLPVEKVPAVEPVTVTAAEESEA